jgi:hypothetical protein
MEALPEQGPTFGSVPHSLSASTKAKLGNNPTARAEVL